MSRKLGLAVCLLGSAAALLYPPYTIIDGVRWGFAFEELVSAFGKTIYVFDQIDQQTLLIELGIINAIGLAIFIFSGRR